MKTFSFYQLIGIICLLGIGTHQDLKAQMNTDFADTLEQTFTQFASTNDMEGVATAVVFPDGSIWSSATGHHGADPLHTNLLYDIGSNTKSMISTLILLLEEEGKLSINDTLYQFISPIHNVPSSITLKQLMGHRSGLHNFTEHPDFFDDMLFDFAPFWHPDTVLSRYLLAPLFTPGGGWSYCNTNYMLLGKVIEAIEMLPLNEVLSNRLFVPYQLNHCYLEGYDPYTLGKTGCYVDPGDYWGQHFHSFLSSAWAAGGVVSTPEDLASWAYQLFRGDILNATSMHKMKLGTNLNSGERYGLGIMSVTYNGRAYLKHGGTTLQNSEMDYSVESDFSVAVIDLDLNFYTETRGLQNALIDVLEYAVDHPVSVANELEVVDLNVYPNPSSQTIQIALPIQIQGKGVHLEVYDTKGNLIFQENLKSPEMRLHKEDIGTGVFYLKVSSDGYVFPTKRIIFS